MNDTRPAQIRPHHLQRLAIVYIRQSTPQQVLENTGSTSHQRQQKEYAIRWGWPPSAIEVVEDDLGMSGTSGDRRKGWQALLKRVTNEQVGLILAADTSRLTRSSADFETLLGVCQASETLLAVEGVIVDPNDSSNRLLARLRANVAQFENEARAEMFMKAKRTKVREGLAVTRCPTGYVATRKGRWAKDPDGAVRSALEEVFKQYELLGSLGRVLRFFDAHGLQLPVRTRAGELRWTRPTINRIHHLLWNPSYAGLYVYGRQRCVKGSRKNARRVVDWSECLVVEDHHEPYISPATWRANLERLRRNRVPGSPPSGDGPGLCQGRIRCGRCGGPMSTHYTPGRRKVGIEYICQTARKKYGEAQCWSVSGSRLDEVVEAELLRCLARPDVEAVLGAADEVNAGYEAARRQRQAELDRAEAEAKVTKRLLKEANPDNRLMVIELMNDLDLALQGVQEVKLRQAQTPLAPPLDLTPDRVAAIQSLTAELPALWAAPWTTNSDRKALVRLLVREIRVVANSEIEFEVEIAWVGGATTRHRVFRPKAGALIARRLVAEGRTVREIAAELNRLGLTTIHNRRPYTPKGVRFLIVGVGRTAGLSWAAYRETLRAPLTELFQAGQLDTAIAAEFNRRGFRSFRYNLAWTARSISKLRNMFGPRRPTGRPRLDRNSLAPRLRACDMNRLAVEALRAPLTELVQAGRSDPAIAVEFNRRELPKWGLRTSWTMFRVRNLRHKLGIYSRSRSSLRSSQRVPVSEVEQ